MSKKYQRAGNLDMGPDDLVGHLQKSGFADNREQECYPAKTTKKRGDRTPDHASDDAEYLRGSLAQMETERDALKAELERERAAHSKEIFEKTTHIALLEDQLEAQKSPEGEGAVARVREEIEEAEKTNRRLRSDLAKERGSRMEMEKKASELEKKLAEAEQSAQGLLTELDSVRQKSQQLERDLSTANVGWESLKILHNTLEEQRTRLSTDLQQKEKELGEANEKLAQQPTVASDPELQKKLAEAEQSAQSLRTELDSERQKLQQLERDLSNANRGWDSEKILNATLDEEIKRLVQENGKKLVRVTQLTEEVKQGAEALAKVTLELDALKASAPSNQTSAPGSAAAQIVAAAASLLPQKATKKGLSPAFKFGLVAIIVVVLAYFALSSSNRVSHQTPPQAAERSVDEGSRAFADMQRRFDN